VDTQCASCVELGQECSNEEEYILRDGNVDNVQCIDGICQCIVDLRPDVDNNQCNSGLFDAVNQKNINKRVSFTGVTNTVAVISMAIVIAAAKLF
jgi:hypothetical protein